MNLNFEEAKNKTIEFLNKTSYSLVRPEFSKYSMIYLFTTENLSYLEKISVKEKDVLTVTGSFDQCLNLIFEGATKVCNFDVNLLSTYFSYLKMAAMKCFSYQQYLDFFMGEKNFDYSMYLKIRNYLKTPFLEYWDFIYQHFSYRGEDILKSRLFDRPLNLENVILSNPYLKCEENYEATKRKLDLVDISFQEKDILQIGDGNDMYDLMLFSNIESSLVDDFFSEVSETEYLDFIKNKASKQLRDGGLIQIAYKYRYRYKNPQKVQSILKRIFDKQNKVYQKKEYLEMYKKILVMGYSLYNAPMNSDTEDCVYFYQKGEKVQKI